MKYRITSIEVDVVIIEVDVKVEGYIEFNFNKNLYLLSNYDGKQFMVKYEYNKASSFKKDIQNFINNYGE